ncbi:hypothetical protein BBIA_2571, partial [Bifidobacterium biavatii DSM 23969]
HRIPRRQRRDTRMPRTRHARPHPQTTHERHPRVLRPPPRGERAHRRPSTADSKPSEASPRLPQPRQLHHQKPTPHRRIQTRHPNPPLTTTPTHQNAKSPILESPCKHWRLQGLSNHSLMKMIPINKPSTSSCADPRSRRAGCRAAGCAAPQSARRNRRRRRSRRTSRT